MKLTKERAGIYTGEYDGHRWRILNMRISTTTSLHTTWPGLWEARCITDPNEIRHAPSLREVVKMIKNSGHTVIIHRRRRR